MTEDFVEIVLASFNGAAYIGSQLESLLSQTHQNFRLLIQDDGSKDGTLSIVKKYVRQYPQKMILTNREERTGGAQGNFFSLLSKTIAPFVMLCDQDDVWRNDKIEKTLKEMKRLENGDRRAPVLIHTDLTVVDEALCVLAASYFQQQRLTPTHADFSSLLSQNVVTGCTVMVNRALLDLLDLEPQGPLMHDHWLALLAAAFGKIGVLFEPTLLYRQHAGNVLGAKRKNAGAALRRFCDPKGAKEAVNGTYRQARAFLKRYGDRLDEDKRYVLLRYASLPAQPKFKRLFTLLRYGPLKRGAYAKLGQLFFC